MASQTLGWLFLAIQLALYASQATAQNSQCNATAEQPVVDLIFPPSGTTGPSTSFSSSNYSIQGERLNMVFQITVQLNDITNRVINVLDMRIVNDSLITYNLGSTFGLQRNPGGTPATLRVIPTNTACQTITNTIAIHESLSITPLIALTAQPGTTAFFGLSSCYPPICGDNSTEFNMIVAGITLENLQASSGFAARFPNFDLPEPTSSSIFMMTQYQTFSLGLGLRYNLVSPGVIQSVTPSRGQRGTRVIIRGQNLLSAVQPDLVAVSLSHVSLGDNTAEIISSNQSVIEIRAMSGTLGTATIRINTTQTFEGQTFDGPYISLVNGWIQLEDGVVSSIIPPAAQPGRSVIICGDRLQGGGNAINRITIANISATNFLMNVFTASAGLPGTECVSADVPSLPMRPQTRTGSIIITADTGATVESMQAFTFAEIQLVSPQRGQVGTIVAITGIGLLSGYNTAMPVVYLSGVQATVMSFNSTRIVVRVEEPPMPSNDQMSGAPFEGGGSSSGSGSGQSATIPPPPTTTAMPEPEIFGVPGSVAIMVTNPMSMEFNVTDEDRWIYERPGEIVTVSPGFGQAGTRITIRGTSLIGYGSRLLNATVGNVRAMIIQETDSEVQLSVGASTVTGLVDIVLFSDTGAQIRGEEVFEYRDMGSIVNVQPSNGQNGTFVTISGTNLFGHGNNITSVKFGDVPASIDYTQSTSSSITVRITSNPNAMNTPVGIEITADTFAIVTSAGNVWTYLVQGTIQDVQPGEGQEGTRITIDGTNLLGGGVRVASIFLDGVNATVVSNTSTSITVIMGNIGQQRADFFPGQVYIMADTGAVVFGGSYTHRASGQITSFSPLRGREGTFVSIMGTNLLGFGMTVSSVQVAGANAMVLSFNNMAISIRLGTNTQLLQGPIRIQADTGAVITSATNFTYILPGMVTNVSPTSGAEGTGVLVSGTSLVPDMSQLRNITVGGILVSRIVFATQQQVSFIVGPAPEMNPDNAEIVITANDGSVVNNAFFTFVNLTLSLPGRTSGQEGTTIDIILPPNATNFDPSFQLIPTVDDQTAQIVSIDTQQRSITVRVPRARRQGMYTADVAVRSTDGLVARLRNAFTYLSEGYILDVSPDNGQMGTIVTIRGENLLGGGTQISNATLAGVPTTFISSRNDSEMIQVSISENPTGTTFPRIGHVVLTADTGAVIQRLNAFTLIQPGEITSISPTTGQDGTIVTIRGARLLQGTSTANISNVYLAGIASTVQGNATDTEIVVRAGEGFSTDRGPVVITLTSGAVITSTIAFQYLEPGSIAMVSPNSGTVGTRVSISGTNLLGGGSSVSVTLGGTPANVTTATDTLIDVVSNRNPDAPQGASDVIIEANTGAEITGSQMWFYERLGNITTISPTVGQQGVDVTISGQSLLGPSGTSFTECLLSNIPARIGTFSSSQVVCTAGENPNPRTMLTGTVQLTTDTGVVIESVLNTTNFTYYSSFVDEIQPTSGNNGTNVVISGMNLFGPPNSSFSVDRVMFGSIEAQVVTSSPNEIRVRVGLSLNETFDETVRIESTSGSIVELQNAWNFTEPGEIFDISPTFGFPGENVTISGANLVPESATSATVFLGQSESFSARIVNSSVIEFRAGVYDGLNNPGEGLPIQIVADTGETLYDDSILFTFNETVGEVVSFTPEAGEAGTVVNIIGVNLLNNQTLISVSIGGVEVAEIINATEDEIFVTVGPGPSEGAYGPIEIETGEGQLVGVAGDAWRYYPVLSASLISPQTGQNGTLVSIDLSTFEDLPDLSDIYLTDVAATIIELDSNQILTVQAGPSDATQMGSIRLEFVNGTSVNILNAWRYESPVSIANILPSFSGYFNTSLTISGANFLAGGVSVMDISLAGIGTTVDASSNTEIQLTITEFANSSSAPIVGPIVVTTSEGATFTSAMSFTYVQVRIDSVSPQSGTQGTRVNITGVGLLAGGRSVETLLLGEIEAGVNQSSDSFVLAVAEPFETETNISDIVYITDTGAVVTIEDSWEYITPGQITGVTPEEGNMGTIVTITGTNLFGGGNRAETVLLNGVPASQIVVNYTNVIQVLSGSNTTALRPGLIQIVADTGAVTGSSPAVTFGYLTPGNITSVEPQEGQNGTRVTIQGMFLHNGEGVRRVLLAGVEAIIETITENNQVSGRPTTIIIRAGRPSSFGSFLGSVQIESNFNTTTLSSSNFTYLSEGTIFSVTPEQGQNGTLVTIRGENLLGGGTNLTNAYLGGLEATITSATSSLVTVEASENDITAPETGDVVFIANSGAYVRRIDGWTYISQGEITSINPPAGQFGTNITISGQTLLSGGSSIVEVLLDNITIYSIISSTDTEVQVRVGEPGFTVEEFTTSSVTLRSNFGAVLYQEFPWNYTNQSMILDVSPQNGSGLTIVTLTGENLLGGGMSIMSVEAAGISANRIIFSNDSVVVFETGFNSAGLEIMGDIRLESDTGAITVGPNAWRYDTECPAGQFGTIQACFPCDDQCELCFGANDTDCFTCRNFLIQNINVSDTGDNMQIGQCVEMCPNVSTLDNICRDACELNQFVRVNSTQNVEYCYDCHPLCAPNLGCSGPEPSQCGGCRNFFNTLNQTCVEECPIGTHANESNNCLPCDSQCVPESGCYGSSPAECNECANFRVSANLINPNSPGSSDICMENCPSLFYPDPDSNYCQPCDDACAINCTGPNPFDCIACRNYSFESENDRRRCVLNCNPDPNNMRHYEGSDGVCRPCSNLCSLTGGCSSSRARDCNGCRVNNDTQIPLPEFEGECMTSCPNNTYYQDSSTFDCRPCSSSCTNGCTGPNPNDCIPGAQNAFAAGGGTIAIVVILIIILVIIVVLLGVFLVWKFRRGDTYTIKGSDGDNIEMGARYERRNETDFTSQPRRPSSPTSTETQPEKAAPKGVANVGFGDGELYTELGPEDDENKVSQIDEEYTEMEPGPLKKQQPQQQEQKPKEPVVQSAPGTQTDVPPSRPPKPGPKLVETKKEPASPPKGAEKDSKPPPPVPPSPEMYIDMQRSGIHEVFVNPATSQGPEEEYSEMSPVHAVNEVEAEFYDDAESVRGTLPRPSLPVPESKPKPRSEERAPLIKTESQFEDDNLYEETEIAAAEAVQYRRSQSNNELPPALPSKPVPKKRYSTPLPQTPLQKSVASTSSLPSISAEPEALYMDTEGPIEESLYEDIPGRLLPDLPPPSSSKKSEPTKKDKKKRK